MRKVAIVGRCYSTRRDAPWHDPSWEKWSLGWDPVSPLTQRIFELHTNFRLFLGSQREGDFHVSGLRMSKTPIYMLERHEDIPASVRYPMEDIHRFVGNATGMRTPYLESSIAYMLALAILENADHIGVWGVDLHCESEYAFQRPNLEYLIGLARGKGLRVFIPPQSALLTHQMGKPYGYWSATEAGAPQTSLAQGVAA